MSEDATLDDFIQISDDIERKSVRWGPKTKTIPSDWGFDPIIGHATEIIYPQRDKPTRFDGEIPWVRIEDLNGVYISEPQDGERYVSRELMDEMNLRSFPEGTLMCSCSTTMGVCAITTQELLSNQTFAGVVTKDSINTHYLYYAISDCAEELEQIATGSTISYLSSDKLEGFHIPIPPLEEQRKIASVLYNVDQAIQKTEEIIEQTERVKRGVSQDLFHHGINGEETKESWVGEIPETWDVVQFSEIVDSNRNGLYKSEDAYGDGYPIAKMGNALE